MSVCLSFCLSLIYLFIHLSVCLPVCHLPLLSSIYLIHLSICLSIPPVHLSVCLAVNEWQDNLRLNGKGGMSWECVLFPVHGEGCPENPLNEQKESGELWIRGWLRKSGKSMRCLLCLELELYFIYDNPLLTWVEAREMNTKRKLQQ